MWRVGGAVVGPVAFGCRLCTARRTGRPVRVVRYAARWERACARHARWSPDADADGVPEYLELHEVPEVVRAQRRWAGVARRAARGGVDPEAVFGVARAVVCRRWESAPREFPTRTRSTRPRSDSPEALSSTAPQLAPPSTHQRPPPEPQPSTGTEQFDSQTHVSCVRTPVPFPFRKFPGDYVSRIGCPFPPHEYRSGPKHVPGSLSAQHQTQCLDRGIPLVGNTTLHVVAHRIVHEQIRNHRRRPAHDGEIRDANLRSPLRVQSNGTQSQVLFEVCRQTGILELQPPRVGTRSRNGIDQCGPHLFGCHPESQRPYPYTRYKIPIRPLRCNRVVVHSRASLPCP
ncbi:hypothetical protein EHYA_04781 [Embleya hyalina]|uniref:Uncharacterized protein n=1 Tax=Embleya hyalina TaxID=516124 RepID=A0A401YR67_9ACTN|nr:hypothetical protein EHYA_04781 [Embleya hyalina]